MSAPSVPFVSKRLEFAQVIQKIQHVAPAAALLIQGVDRLAREGHGWSILLGAAELGTSALVIGAFGLQIRAARRAAAASPGHGHDAPHHGVDWVDLFLGAMLLVEVWAHWHETGHVKRPTVLLAVAMLVLGVSHGRIAAFARRRRGLWIDDTGIRVATRPFRHFSATWTELAAIDLTPREARIVRRDGRTSVIDLHDLRNAADVRAAIEGARLRLPQPEPEPEPEPVAAPAPTQPAPGSAAPAAAAPQQP